MDQYLKAKNTQGRQMCSDGPAYFTCRIFDSQAIARVSMIFSVGCFNYIKYVIPLWSRQDLCAKLFAGSG